MAYIATFHTHFGAMRFHKQLANLDNTAKMMPVPRKLSASCGTCVRFCQPFDPQTMSEEDLEKVFAEEEIGGEYREIFANEEF